MGFKQGFRREGKEGFEEGEGLESLHFGVLLISSPRDGDGVFV